MKRQILFLLTAILLLLISLSACNNAGSVYLPSVADYESNNTAAPRNHLKIGVVSGPYGDMFMDAVYPVLNEMGYTAELVYYDSFPLLNFALSSGEIDLNIFQNYRYLIDFGSENDINLSAIAEVPTVSMGIYSSRFRSVGLMPYGAAIAVPDDNINYSRALVLLEDAGVIGLDPSIDRTKATADDIIRSPFGADIIRKQTHMLPDSLSNCDFAVITGDFALSGGLKIYDALHTERLDADYFNVIAVRTEDLGEQFVQDIISVLRSDKYRTVITAPNGEYSNFERPLNFYAGLNAGR